MEIETELETTDTEIEDDPATFPLPLQKKKKRHPNRHFKYAQKPVLTTYASFDELKRALEILKSPNLRPNSRNYCISKKPILKIYHHKCVLHYCNLIKNAILKQNWRPICKLLVAYISKKKFETNHELLILKYTFLYLLNDPVAIQNSSLREFLHLGLSCRTSDDRRILLQKLTMPPFEFKNKS